jgi:hypothetical protein
MNNLPGYTVKCVKTKGRSKIRRQARRKRRLAPDLEAILAPTIVWHPSISLEKLISDIAEYRDSIIVS